MREVFSKKILIYITVYTKCCHHSIRVTCTHLIVSVLKLVQKHWDYIFTHETVQTVMTILKGTMISCLRQMRLINVQTVMTILKGTMMECPHRLAIFVGNCNWYVKATPSIYYVYIKNQEDQCKNISPCLKRCIYPLCHSFKQFVSLLDFPILYAIPNHKIMHKNVIKHCWDLSILPLWAYFISIIVHKMVSHWDIL